MTRNAIEDRPEFWIVAGPNGAGKTTCVQLEPISAILPDVKFLNPDNLTLDKIKAAGHVGFADAPIDLQKRLFIQAANETFDDLVQSLARSQAVGIETVLSTDKYRPLVKRVMARGGFVGLIYIALSSPEISRTRVAARVRAGGHDVPSEKLEGRWKRSLENLTWFAKHATAFWVIDNSDSNPDQPPQLIATGKYGKLDRLNPLCFSEIKSALARLPLSGG